MVRDDSCIIKNEKLVTDLPDTFEAAAGRVYVAGVGGSRRWAGSRRWRRILAVTGLRRTFAACFVGPTSVKIAFNPFIMLFCRSKSSQMFVSRPSKPVFL